jgi:hypothetical protein
VVTEELRDCENSATLRVSKLLFAAAEKGDDAAV